MSSSRLFARSDTSWAVTCSRRLINSSGVEFDKMDEAQGEILAQLEAVKAVDFTEEELHSAKQAVINSFQSVLDSRAGLEQYWLASAVSGMTETPEELIERLKEVTAKDVSDLAKSLELDTIYRLMGKEG